MSAFLSFYEAIFVSLAAVLSVITFLLVIKFYERQELRKAGEART